MRASRSVSKPGLSRAPRTAVLLLSLVAAALLVATPAVEAKRKDRIPPTFAGLKSAVTCIPGPIGGGRTSSYHLSWDPAPTTSRPRARSCTRSTRRPRRAARTSPRRRTPRRAAQGLSTLRSCPATRSSTSWPAPETRRETAIPTRLSARVRTYACEALIGELSEREKWGCFPGMREQNVTY